MRVSLRMESTQAKVLSDSLMEKRIKESSKKDSTMVEVTYLSPTENNTKENSSTDCIMEKEKSNLLMTNTMKVNSLKARNKARANGHGLLASSILENYLKMTSMVKEA
jgi:hypothetical protein